MVLSWFLNLSNFCNVKHNVMISMQSSLGSGIGNEAIIINNLTRKECKRIWRSTREQQ